MFFDDILTANKHIKHIETKLSAASAAIYVRKYIPQKPLRSVYDSLVCSPLQYAVICWGNSSKIMKQKLLLKKIVS